jgi:hypothetical protein
MGDFVIPNLVQQALDSLTDEQKAELKIKLETRKAHLQQELDALNRGLGILDGSLTP